MMKCFQSGDNPCASSASIASSNYTADARTTVIFQSASELYLCPGHPFGIVDHGFLIAHSRDTFVRISPPLAVLEACLFCNDGHKVINLSERY